MVLPVIYQIIPPSSSGGPTSNVQITDLGTGAIATVLPGNTPPDLSNKALVVAISPSSNVADGAAIPVGTRGLLFAGKDPTGKSRFIAVDATGKILSAFTLAQPSAAVVSPVPQSVVVQTLLAANPVRLGALIQNDIINGFLFIKLGAGASPTDWSAKIAPGFAYELPFPAYTGQITGIWSIAGSGTAQVTEMT